MHRLQREYDCQTTSQKMQCEIAALGFVRMLDVQKRLQDVIEKPQKSQLTINYMDKLSKDLERAQRQYNSAIQSLQYSNRPPVKMTVNVKGPVGNIGQNQQFNNNE